MPTFEVRFNSSSKFFKAQYFKKYFYFLPSFSMCCLEIEYTDNCVIAQFYKKKLGCLLLI